MAGKSKRLSPGEYPIHILARVRWSSKVDFKWDSWLKTILSQPLRFDFGRDWHHCKRAYCCAQVSDSRYKNSRKIRPCRLSMVLAVTSVPVTRWIVDSDKSETDSRYDDLSVLTFCRLSRSTTALLTLS